MTEFIAPADFTIKDEKTPVSSRFDDIYFSIDDGLAESEYVFYEGGYVAEFFAQHKNVSIGETGFGTGLNFLLTWLKWRKSRSKGQLHYYALEGYPVQAGVILELFKVYPELTDLADELSGQYPPMVKGFHHLQFEEGRVTLTLMFGEAADVLSKLNGSMDVWYLDGFAPAKNPDMWNDDVFAEIGRLSQAGTKLTTFTAAGFVKRGLITQGFEMTKRKGFGRKRDSLIGVMKDKPELKSQKPWFSFSKNKVDGKKVAIIGGGIAGSLSAFKLKRAGFDVHLFEKVDCLGAEGSGNRIGIIEPRLILDMAGGGRFNHLSYLHALRTFDALEAEGIQVWKGKRGLFNLSQNEDDLAHQKAILAAEILPPAHLQYIAREKTKEITGMELPNGGLWYPQSGCLEPKKLCEKLTQDVSVHLNANIEQLIKTDKEWQLVDQDQKTLFEGDQVVICTAGATHLLDRFFDTQFQARRGQVSYIPKTVETSDFDVALTCGGYLLPSFDGDDHIIGATFDYGFEFDKPGYDELLDKSHADNLSKIERFIPDWKGEAIGGRAGMRALAADKRPVVGPVFDQKWYLDAYADLKHGPRKRQFEPAQYVDGLWVMNALGSRGVQSAPLLCDILTCYMTKKPFITEASVVEALHPARFLMRDIIKGKK